MPKQVFEFSEREILEAMCEVLGKKGMIQDAKILATSQIQGLPEKGYILRMFVGPAEDKK